MQLVHIDTCLSCFHLYNNEYTLQVDIDNTTTYSDVKHALKDYATWSHIDLDLTNVQIKELADELFYNVELTKVVDSSLEDCEKDCGEYCDPVYMFFALVGYENI